MITLTQYVEHRLGRTPKEQAKNFLGKPFKAVSVTEFWMYWNPVWNYSLYYYCYKPLSRYVPRWLGVLATFIVCGLIHDLPFSIHSMVTQGKFPRFTITLFLTINGLLQVLTELAHFKFSGVRTILRPLIHAAILFLSYWAALHIDVIRFI